MRNSILIVAKFLKNQQYKKFGSNFNNDPITLKSFKLNSMIIS